MDTQHLNQSNDISQKWLEVVRRSVESLRFGTVEIIVHDGRVIQIETTEKLRFDKGGPAQESEVPKEEGGARPSPAWKASSK